MAEVAEIGWGAQVVKQLASIGFTAAFAVVMTVVIVYVLRAVMGDLRVDEEAEHRGLDLSEHSETAYGGSSS